MVACQTSVLLIFLVNDVVTTEENIRTKFQHLYLTEGIQTGKQHQMLYMWLQIALELLSLY